MKQEPYYAVIFSSQLKSADDPGYEKTALRMVELAKQQKGFLGVESARSADGFGITISYWQTTEDIAAWRAHAEHEAARETGREKWYSDFKVRVCKVERDYSFGEKR